MSTLLFVVSLPTAWVVIGGLALLFVASLLLAGMFGPMPRYSIQCADEMPKIESEGFLSIWKP